MRRLNWKIKNLVYYSNRDKYSTARNFRNEQIILNCRDKWITSTSLFLESKLLVSLPKVLPGIIFQPSFRHYTRGETKNSKIHRKEINTKSLQWYRSAFWQIEQRARIPPDQPESLSFSLRLNLHSRKRVTDICSKASVHGTCTKSILVKQ